MQARAVNLHVRAALMPMLRVHMLLYSMHELLHAVVRYCAAHGTATPEAFTSKGSLHWILMLRFFYGFLGTFHVFWHQTMAVQIESSLLRCGYFTVSDCTLHL